MSKVAFITGITGQDGSYLAELLLAKGYEVHGLIRRSSQFNTYRIEHIFDQIHLHHGDVTDALRIRDLIERILPHEIYNLAAQSHVKVSFDTPADTMDIVAGGCLNLLEALRAIRKRWPIYDPAFYQAGSSEMFGDVLEPVQSERTPFNPVSPYAVAKVNAHYMTAAYRSAYGIRAWNGILFNHESPRRGETFVTRKITRAVGRIVHGLQDYVVLGNMDAKRDWGFAGDYVDAMWTMLQSETPNDYVVATGETYSVRDFCRYAFERVGLDYTKHVLTDEKYYRPNEVKLLLGDPTKIKTELGWKPVTDVQALANMMVDYDLKLAEKEKRNG